MNTAPQRVPTMLPAPAFFIDPTHGLGVLIPMPQIDPAELFSLSEGPIRCYIKEYQGGLFFCFVYCVSLSQESAFKIGTAEASLRFSLETKETRLRLLKEIEDRGGDIDIALAIRDDETFGEGAFIKRTVTIKSEEVKRCLINNLRNSINLETIKKTELSDDDLNYIQSRETLNFISEADAHCWVTEDRADKLIYDYHVLFGEPISKNDQRRIIEFYKYYEAAVKILGRKETKNIFVNLSFDGENPFSESGDFVNWAVHYMLGRIFEELKSEKPSVEFSPFGGNHLPRVKQIGHKLNQIGGFNLMTAVYDAVSMSQGPFPHGMRDIELIWAGIGEWQG
jgi:hypothetical protein